MIPRTAENTLRQLAKGYPVLAITGPRQSGKTTLAQAIFDRGLDPGIWHGNYVQTYLERDVRQLINVRDLGQFQRFLRLCAGRTGQLLNLSALGDEAGLSHNTVRE